MAGDERSDGELVRAALAGERPACEGLVRRWSARVLAVCHARVGRRDAAEDLAQEALLRGVRGLATLADPHRFGPWLCGIASRTCLDWLKSSQRTEVSLDAIDRPPPATDGPDPSDAEELERLMAAVHRLPEEYREAVLLYYYQDATYADLAQMLGVSAATINARLTKARAMLRDRLGATRARPAR